MNTRRLLAVSAGLAFASSCFPLLASVVASLGPWAVVAILGSGGLAWLVSRIYGELAGSFPGSAGVRTYIGAAFGDRAGLAVALLYLFLVIGLGASEAYVFSQVLAHVFPGVPAWPVILGFIAACAGTNVLGIEPTGRVQAVLTFGMLAAVVGLAGLGLATVPAVSTIALAPTNWTMGVPAAVFLFVGFEWVVSAVERPDPTGRSLPRAMSGAVGVLALSYVALALALWVAIPTSELGNGVTQHVALGGKIGGKLGLLFVLGLSTLATLTSFNGGILGSSRLVYALAREGVLPRGLAAIHPRFLTPHRAIVAMTVITAASALALAGPTARVPILVGSAIECIVFALVALAWWKLRVVQPNRARPWKTALPVAVAPLLAVAFAGLGAGCLAAAGDEAPLACGLLGGSVLACTAWAARKGRAAPRSKPAGLLVTK